MIKIPFTIKIIEVHNPNGPDGIYKEIMDHLLAEKQFYLNGLVQKEVNKLFKERITLLRENTSKFLKVNL